MQLRGERLKEFLALKLIELVRSYEERSMAYVYSQKEFALYAAVSRETVRKYQAYIDLTLQEKLIPKHDFDGDAKLRNAERRLAHAEHQLATFKAMYLALRAQHAFIFETLIRNSFDVSLLASSGEVQYGANGLLCTCILCGGEVIGR